MKTTIKILIILTAVLVATSYRYKQVQEVYFDRHMIAAKEFVHALDPDNDYLNKLLKGIDYKKPVYIITIKKGTRLIQYQTPNSKQGNFYGYENSTPNDLGISPFGWDPIEKRVMEKEKRYYIATQDFKGLVSYTAPIVDDWSTPEIETQTSGHSIQVFTSCKACLSSQGESNGK